MFPKQATISSFSKRLLLLLIVGCSAMFLINGIYALGPAQSQVPDEERKLKVKEFKGMPLELVAVRNLQSETWYDDLEIELKNVSDKPIYFLTAYIVFPEEKVASGESAVRLSWGDPKKLDSNNVASPEADNIEPGKTFAIAIPKMYVKGLRAMERLRPKSTRNLILRFQKTYFGDGTGFEVEDWFRDFRGNGPPRQLHPLEAQTL